MVALDLDGTLLSNDRQIATEQALYLRDLHSKGFTVCIATGRAPTGVYDHVQKLGIPDLPVVCSNGARGFYCSTTRTTEELFYNPVPKNIVERTIRLANRLGYAIQYYHQDDSVFANQKTDMHYKLTKQYSDYTGVRIDHVDDDFHSLLEQNCLPSKLLVLFDEPDPEIARRYFTDEFTAGEATVVKGYCTWFLEVLSSTVNKGEGLKRMCTALNIPLEEVIAIGDGCNDIEFIQMAGLGVAVSNAEPEVKEVANLTIDYSNDQHGVMKVLQQLQEQNRLRFVS
jgi:Cof subfamily protein (haloacid dehalogenase superfamily)